MPIVFFRYAVALHGSTQKQYTMYNKTFLAFGHLNMVALDFMIKVL